MILVQSRSDLEEVEKSEVDDWSPSSRLLRDKEKVTVIKPGSCNVADYLYNVVLLHGLYQRLQRKGDSKTRELRCRGLKDRRAVRFMIEPLSTNADESPVMGEARN